MSNKEDRRNTQYVFSQDPNSARVNKLDTDTGLTYCWLPRSRSQRDTKSYTESNKKIIEALHALGYHVRIRHFRWATYQQQRELFKKNTREYFARTIVVPSTFTKNPMYTILPKGGYTHITVKDSNDQVLCASSECSVEEPFCYAAGVAEALRRLPSALLW